MNARNALATIVVETIKLAEKEVCCKNMVDIFAMHNIRRL